MSVIINVYDISLAIFIEGVAMYSDKDYPTASQIIQLGNIVNWFRNRNLQVYGLTSSQSEAIYFILKHEDEEHDMKMEQQYGTGLQ